MTRLFYLGAIFLSGIGVTGFAIPLQISYGARLTDNSGNPMALAGGQGLRVTFWDAQTNGNQEPSTNFDFCADGTSCGASAPASTFINVTLNNGAFQVLIAMSAAHFHSVFPNSGTSNWIQVELVNYTGSSVTGVVQTFARQQFAASPYALKIPVDGSTLVYNSSGQLAAGVMSSANVDWASPGAIGATTPSSGSFTSLAVNISGAGSTAVVAHNTTTLSYGDLANGNTGVYGQTNVSAGIGVEGYNNNTASYGYLGYSNVGVYGSGAIGMQGVGTGGGVYGAASSAGGYGVEGVAQNGNSYGYLGDGNAYGVFGFSNSNLGGLFETSTAFTDAFLAENTATAYYCYIGTGSYSIACSGPTSGVSDQRLKKNIKPLTPADGLDTILKLNPVRYQWKDNRKNVGGRYELGLLAQEVEKTLPELVIETKQPAKLEDPDVKGKIKSVSYERLIVPMIKAQQDMWHRFSDFKDTEEKTEISTEAQLIELRRENATLRKQVDALKSYLCGKDSAAPVCR